MTGGAIQHLAATPASRRAALLGVDLGPNLPVTGSLSAILWMIAIRRDGEDVTARDFFKGG